MDLWSIYLESTSIFFGIFYQHIRINHHKNSLVQQCNELIELAAQSATVKPTSLYQTYSELIHGLN